MIDKKYLLNTEQMANFVTDGYLRFDELIPRELNEAAHAEMEEGIIVRGRGGTVLDEVWDDDSAVGKVFDFRKCRALSTVWSVKNHSTIIMQFISCALKTK